MLEVMELVDVQENPWCFYAEGHHDAAAFLEAVRRYEIEAVGEVLYELSMEDVRRTHFATEYAPDLGQECYVPVPPEHPGALPVTIAYLA